METFLHHDLTWRIVPLRLIHNLDEYFVLPLCYLKNLTIPLCYAIIFRENQNHFVIIAQLLYQNEITLHSMPRIIQNLTRICCFCQLLVQNTAQRNLLKLKLGKYFQFYFYCEAQGKGRAKGRLRRSIKGHLQIQPLSAILREFQIMLREFCV